MSKNTASHPVGVLVFTCLLAAASASADEGGLAVGEMQVVESGVKPDERVVVSGILDAVPGQKVDPQLRTPTSAAADPVAPK